MNLSQYVTDRPVYALRARGFEKGESYFSTMFEIIKVYHDAIKRVQPSGPYCLCGYSFGATVAFEIAQYMELYGDDIQFLGVIDQPPHIKMRAQTYDWAECALTIAFFIGLIDEAHAYKVLPEFRNATTPSSEIIDYIFRQAPDARVKETDMTKEKLTNWANLAHLLKSISSNYDPTGYVKEMDVFWTDPLVGLVEAKNKDEWRQEYIGKWLNFVTGKDRFQYVRGGHRKMISPPYVKDFAAVFMEALERREAGVDGDNPNRLSDFERFG